MSAVLTPTTLASLILFYCFAILHPPAHGQVGDERNTQRSQDSTPSTSEKVVDAPLQDAIEPLLRKHQGDVAVSIRNLDSGQWYQFNAEVPMPTASLIKLPVLVAVYQAADRGELDLNQQIRLSEEDKVPGSGILTEHFSSDASLPLVDYVRLMIRYSDNTATNVVAEQIGLMSTAKAMEALGLDETKLHSKVYRGDTSVFPQRSRRFGLGSTTAGEMVDLLELLHRGKLANAESTQAILQHLLACEDRSKLGALLPRNVKFAHKTGAIANCRTDAGIIYTSGGPVAVCFLSNKNADQRWSDDNAAQQLAGKIGRVIVQRFGSPESDKRLQIGAGGRLVEALQRTLNERLEPSPELAIDGDFGPATRGAVERFQRSKQLPQTGIVDASTWSALGTLIETDAPVPAPEVVNSEKLAVAPRPSKDDPPIVTCKAWTIIDHEGAKPLYSHNADQRLEPASTTKIMTALITLRYIEENPKRLQERVRFSPRADKTPGSTAAIRADESVSLHECLYGLLLPSGNDASVALAEHVGRGMSDDPSDTDAASAYEHFVDAMNRTARQLGMAHTHFVNPHGLSNSEHKTTANDLAILAAEAMNHERFRTIVSTRQFGCVAQGEQGYARNVLWKNTNRLLGIEGYDGIKTGTTSAAGACLVSTDEQDGRRIIAVVLGSSSSPARYADTRNLFRWAWARIKDVK